MTWVLKEKKGGPLGRPPKPSSPKRPRPPAAENPAEALRPPKPPAPAGYEWVWKGREKQG